MRVKRIGNHDLPQPKRETEGAAGYDLRATTLMIIRPGGSVVVPTGFAWAIPVGKVGMIRDRSGWAAKRGLTTRAGVVDSDYRGEVMVVLRNESDETQTVREGDRIAQMVVLPAYLDEIHETDDLDSTERGAGGFGHTGDS